jgi:hypothetical protein
MICQPQRTSLCVLFELLHAQVNCGVHLALFFLGSTAPQDVGQHALRFVLNLRASPRTGIPVHHLCWPQQHPHAHPCVWRLLQDRQPWPGPRCPSVVDQLPPQRLSLSILLSALVDSCRCSPSCPWAFTACRCHPTPNGGTCPPFSAIGPFHLTDFLLSASSHR